MSHARHPARVADSDADRIRRKGQVEGAVGAYNSLIVADLDGDGHQELYAAGSLGLRRWIFQ